MDDNNKIYDFFNSMHESFVNEYCGINMQKYGNGENLQYDEMYYKTNGIETESKEILQKLVVPKGDSCDGCLHCTTKLKQLVNMFGDPTEIVEEYYCDFFNQELSENGKEFCCKKSVSKCFQCKMNFMSDEERNGNFEQMLLLMLLFDDNMREKAIKKYEESKGDKNADN